MTQAQSSLQKRAEIAGSAGAGVLGMGLGAILAGWLAPYALPLLIFGVALHAWGMFEKHRLDRGSDMPLWSTALFWLCWVLLAALLIWIGLKVFRG